MDGQEDQVHPDDSSPGCGIRITPLLKLHACKGTRRSVAAPHHADLEAIENAEEIVAARIPVNVATVSRTRCQPGRPR